MYIRIFHTSKERCHEICLTEKLLALFKVFSTTGQINIYIFYLDCNTREI